MGNIDFGVSGVREGMGIAQQMQTLQQQKLAHQQQQQQLEIQRSEYIAGKMRNLLLAPDAVREGMTKQLIHEAATLNVPVDPNAIRVASSKDFRDQMLTGLTRLLALPNDQRGQAAVQAITYFGNADELLKVAPKFIAAQGRVVAAQATQQSRQANLDFRQNSKAETTINGDKYLQLNQQRLDGVARINDLLDAADKGQIVTNEQVKNLIGEEVARLELGAGSLGLGQSERNTLISTAKSQFAKITEKLIGTPQDAITGPQLSQMKGQLSVMTDSYMEQTDGRLRALSAGMTPQEKQVADAKAAQLHTNYQQRFGYWGAKNSPNEKSYAVSTGTPNLTPEQKEKFRAHGLDPDSPDFAKAYTDYKTRKTGAPLTPTPTTPRTAPAPIPALPPSMPQTVPAEFTMDESDVQDLQDLGDTQ